MPHHSAPAVTPDKIVDFEKLLLDFIDMLSGDSPRRLMLLQGAGICGKTSLLRLMQWYCKAETIPNCFVDFDGHTYEYPQLDLAREIRRQTGMASGHLVQESGQLYSQGHWLAKAMLTFDQDVSYSTILNAVMLPPGPTPAEMREPTMAPSLIEEFLRDMVEFSNQNGPIVCFFDTFESAGERVETWLMSALLDPVKQRILDRIVVVTAGLRWPSIEPELWRSRAHLVDHLPKMGVRHIMEYARREGLHLTERQALDIWLYCGRGNPMVMGMMVQNRLLDGAQME